MDLTELNVFLTVAGERSFSRAAAKLHRTQPAVSQAIRRLEDDLGERLFDRSAKDGSLTEAGRVLLNYAHRLMRLREEAESAVRELRDLQRGRVLIGANEAAVHTLLPLVARFRARHPQIQVDVRRVHARQIGVEVAQGSLEFGVLTFNPTDRDLAALTIGTDELVMLIHPAHPLATRQSIGIEEFGRLPVVAHNDPSPARERVLRLFETRRVPLNILIALPSLDGIKRAVEMQLGVALLPRRCALREIADGRLVAVPVTPVSRVRPLKLVYRRGVQLSHAAAAFLEMAQELESAAVAAARKTPRAPRRQEAANPDM
jgi:DNA-binding transcriptional LysR family regulator